MSNSTNLIVGAGLSGVTLARLLAESGLKVHVIDKRDHIGGNVYDYIDERTGIRLSKYGAHIFHTSSDEVWEFVNRFSNWTPYEHRVLSWVNDRLVPVPVNITTVNSLFDLNIKTPQDMEAWLKTNQLQREVKNSEDSALNRVGSELYELMFKNYTIKQWAKEPKELEPSVLERIPVRTDLYDRYFSDKYEALPSDGYTTLIKNILDHPNITVELNKEYDGGKYDRVFFTGKIDSYFKEKFGKLEYRSLFFEYEYIDQEDYQPVPVVNYPGLEYPYTRIIDYKKFYPIKTNQSIIAKEYSTDEGEEYYPVPSQRNRDIYKKYQTEALKLEQQGIYFVGRLAEYKYYNMDMAILSSINLFNKIIRK